MRVWETVVVYRTLYDTGKLDIHEFFDSIATDAYVMSTHCFEVNGPEDHYEWGDMLDHWHFWGKDDLIMEGML